MHEFFTNLISLSGSDLNPSKKPLKVEDQGWSCAISCPSWSNLLIKSQQQTKFCNKANKNGKSTTWLKQEGERCVGNGLLPHWPRLQPFSWLFKALRNGGNSYEIIMPRTSAQISTMMNQFQQKCQGSDGHHLSLDKEVSSVVGSNEVRTCRDEEWWRRYKDRGATLLQANTFTCYCQLKIRYLTLNFAVSFVWVIHYQLFFQNLFFFISWTYCYNMYLDLPINPAM